MQKVITSGSKNFLIPGAYAPVYSCFGGNAMKIIGGYAPNERMEDCVVEVMARIHGWEILSMKQDPFVSYGCILLFCQFIGSKRKNRIQA